MSTPRLIQELEEKYPDKLCSPNEGDKIIEIQNDTIILEIDDNTNKKDIENFCEKYPNFNIASAYDVPIAFLISQPALKFKGKEQGSGWNAGSCNLIENCPKRIIIMGEDD